MQWRIETHIQEYVSPNGQTYHIMHNDNEYLVYIEYNGVMERVLDAFKIMSQDEALHLISMAESVGA